MARASTRSPRTDPTATDVRTPAIRRAAPLLAPLLLAALLTGVAVAAVDGAGCDEPAEFVTTAEGVFLVGGCELPNHSTLAGDAAAPSG